MPLALAHGRTNCRTTGDSITTPHRNRWTKAALLLPLLSLAASAMAHAPDRARVEPLIPGATLTHKLVPLDARAIAHLNRRSTAKFNGGEAKWHIYSATKNGVRVGMGALTHSAIPGGELDIAFAVDKAFKVTRVAVVGAPAASKAKLSALAAQMRGKTVRSAFRVGKDLKAPPGLTPRTAQIAADQVHKALLMMDENFNAAHSG